MYDDRQPFQADERPIDFKDPLLIRLLGRAGYDPPEQIKRCGKIDTMFLAALAVADRSPDAQTHVGAVITTPDYRIISTGYNGYPRAIDYSSLPNTRPHKHNWMIHAEANALAWCQRRPENCMVFSTSEICNGCLFSCWQHGITTAFEPKNQTNTNVTEQSRIDREIFLHLSGMNIIKVNIDSLLDGV